MVLPHISPVLQNCQFDQSGVKVKHSDMMVITTETTQKPTTRK